MKLFRNIFLLLFLSFYWEATCFASFAGISDHDLSPSGPNNLNSKYFLNKPAEIVPGWSNNYKVDESAPEATGVTLSGTAINGNTLTLTYTYTDADSDPQGTSIIKWYTYTSTSDLSPVLLSGFSSSTFSLRTVDIGLYLRASITPVATSGTTTGIETFSDFIGPVTNAVPVASAVSVTGSLYLNQILTGTYTYTDLESNPQGTSTYQWYRSDNASAAETAISGATSLNYTITSADLGKYLSFEVIPVATEGTSPGIAVRSSRFAVLNAAPVASGVTISGTYHMGQVLTGVYTYSDLESNAEGTSSYAWYRATDAAGTGKTLISGATTKTYVVQSSDIGYYFSFEVIPVASTGTLSGVSVASNFLGPVVNLAPVASSVTLSGTSINGNTLTLAYTYGDLEGDTQGSSSVKWYTYTSTTDLSPVLLSGFSASTFALRNADVGLYMRASITPVATSGTITGVETFSNFIGPITNAVPVVSSVTVSGSLYLNQTLTGTYAYTDLEGNAEGTSIYQWYRSDNATGTETAISGATSLTYVVTTADLGKYLSFEVTPVASAGTSPGTTVRSARYAVLNAAPVASGVTISGTYNMGQILTGVYTYSDLESNVEGTSSYAWYRATSASGTGKTLITGATTKTYLIQSSDIGYYFSFEVIPVASTGTLSGSAVASAFLGPVVNLAPVASGVTLSGTTINGNNLTVAYTYGDLEGDAQGTSTIKWYTYTSTTDLSPVLLTGFTASTFALRTSEIGLYLRAGITPVASTGTSPGVEVLSNFIGPITNAVPVVSSVSVAGSLYLNQTLTGTYTYTDLEGNAQGTSTYQWYRSDNATGTETAIAGATSLTYVVTTADLGKYLSFEVTPVASAGTSPGTTVRSARYAVLNAAPVASSVTISGTYNMGQILTGVYTYSDLESNVEGTSSYAWYRATSATGTGKTLITGATTKTYLIQSSDIGYYFSFEVIPVASTGTLSGSAVASAFLGPVVNLAPVASGVTLSGSAINGKTLTVTYTYGDLEGDVQGTSTIKWYTYTSTTDLSPVLLTGFSASTFALRTADIGLYLRAGITPVASTGTSPGIEVLSNFIGPITNAVPVASAVSVSGSRYLNQTLTGVYTYSDLESNAQGTSTYQWYRSDTSTGTETAISGATSVSYVVTASDLGKYISFEVTPVASAGTSPGAAVRSARVAILNAAPVASGLGISGVMKVGQILQGTYTFTDLESDAEGGSAYNWYRANDASGTGKVLIVGANTKYYVIQSTDMDKYFSFEVLPVASTGTLSGTAVASSFYGPVSNSVPVASNVRISGTQAVCKTLYGDYDYSDIEADLEGATAFQWYTATSINGTKTAIDGATAKQFTLTTSEQGKYIFFSVIPRALSGNTTGVVTYSNPTGTIVNMLPSVTFSGSSSICSGTSTKLTLSFTGTPPWTLTYTDGTTQSELVSNDYVYQLSVSKGGTYKGVNLVDNIACPVTSLPSTATVSILPLPSVEIVGLNSAYSLKASPVNLVGNPTGGTFTGPGVISSTNMFYPSIAGTTNSPHTIIYEYKSPSTGCTNRDTAIVEVIDADASISGVRSAAKYCNFDNSFVITGANILGVVGNFAISGGVGLTDNGNNTATIYPSALNAGTYTISYSYVDGITLTIYKDITIEVLDEARIFGISSTQYCKNAAPIEISGNYSGGSFSGASVYKNSETSKYYFAPSMVNPGTTTVSYVYITTYGCILSKSVDKVITSVPSVDFEPENVCYNGDSTLFLNHTVYTDQITGWEWSFGDSQSSEKNNKSILFQPKHKYPSIGERTVRLIAQNGYGCKDTLDKVIHLGDIPVASFTNETDCYIKGVPISFSNTSTNVDPIASYLWDMEDTSRLDFKYYTRDVIHTFPIVENYKVKLRITSQYGCKDSITKTIYLRPLFVLHDSTYFADFETGKKFWYCVDTTLTNNWYYGTPDGTKISSASSGTHAYYTDLTETRKNQQLIITGPCFDFSNTTRPYIKMQTFTDATAGQEGAVLQYTIDDGVSWKDVGGYATGINWYNDYSIASLPGNQLIGWSGNNSKYVTSSHNLDFLQDYSRVRFRLVFGESNKTSGTEGFAVDDIQIGSRSKNVLFEHFTNNAQTTSLASNTTLDNVISLKKSDAISIQYHTSFPGVDSFNIHNPSDPGARILYYGVGFPPFTYLDGGTDSKYTYDYSARTPNVTDINIVSLNEAPFSLSYHTTKTKLKISGSVDVTALKAMSGKNLSLHVVIAEDIVTQSGEDSIVYKNVVKKMLPSAGGAQLQSTWSAGEVETVNYAWEYKNVYNPERIHMIAFIQDESSHEIYQTALDDTTKIPDKLDHLNSSVNTWEANVYPNPASSQVNIAFPETEDQQTILQLIDISGHLVFQDAIYKGVSIYELNTANVVNGIYFIRMVNKDKVLITKKLIISH